VVANRVWPEGINPNITVLRPREISPRMLQDQEFHAAEMSLAFYVILKALNDARKGWQDGNLDAPELVHLNRLLAAID